MAEPFSDEAMLFTKELVLQREVSNETEHPGSTLIISSGFKAYFNVGALSDILLFWLLLCCICF